MALTDAYIKELSKLGFDVSPSKSLAARTVNPSEFLRKMYHPGFKIYDLKDGKINTNKWHYPGFMPLAHLLASDDYSERAIGNTLAIESVGRAMRWKNREESPTFVDELINIAIPKDPLALGTKAIRYTPNYLIAKYIEKHPQFVGEEEELLDKDECVVTITSFRQLIEVASMEADFLNRSLEESLNYHWKRELTGVPLTEQFNNTRLVVTLDAITNNDEKLLQTIRNQVVPIISDSKGDANVQS